MHLKNRGLYLLVVAILALPIAGEVPHQAWGTSGLGKEAPVWVSQDWSVVDGELQEQFFHPDLLSSLNRLIASQAGTDADACTNYLRISGEKGAVKGRTAEAVLANSVETVAGTIQDIKQGFIYSQPASVIEVALDHPVRIGDKEFDRIFLILRVAHIQVEGSHLCAESPEVRAAPQVGAVVVLALDRPIADLDVIARDDNGLPLLHPRLNEILISGALPKGYQPYELRVESLRGLLQDRGGKPPDSHGCVEV